MTQATKDEPVDFYQDLAQIGPWCWCGHAEGRHVRSFKRADYAVCGGCLLDGDQEDANPAHPFEGGS